jgi:type II secretion system protein N
MTGAEKGKGSAASVKRILGYTVYACLAAVFFLFLLFPSKDAARYAEARLSGALPGLSASIGDARLVFPLGLRLKDVTLSVRDAEWLEARELTVRPGLFSTLAGKPACSIGGKIFGGTLSADVSLKGKREERVLSASAAVEKLDLSKAKALKTLAGREITGFLSGKAGFSGSPEEWTAGEGKAALVVKSGSVRIEEGLLPVETLTFDDLAVDVEMKDGAGNLARCDISGKQFHGKVSGGITLARPVGTSRLDMKGALKPSPEFFKAMDPEDPMAKAIRQQAGKDGIPVRLTGTLADPKIGLR